jgi:hypothetical protein
VKGKRRAALALLAGAVLAVSGCQSKAGAAAVVAGHRISVKSLDGYVTTSNPTQASLVRTQALQYLVRSELFAAVLRNHGGEPTDAQLAALHDEALPETLKDEKLTGSVADRAFVTGIADDGFAATFVPLFMRSQEMAVELSNRNVSGKELCRVPVSINPRYGAWDWSTTGVRTGATQSNFLVSGPPVASLRCTIGG